LEKKKYWRHVIRGPFYKETEPGMTGTSIFAHHDEYGSGTTLGYQCINTNYELPITHSHNFHELLRFIGGNPENINDLEAEISICLGDELEEYIITSATVVSIPPRLTRRTPRITPRPPRISHRPPRITPAITLSGRRAKRRYD
jgi:hypothetical protein